MGDRRKAAALKYDKGYDAPIVTAAGIGYIADRIIERAKDSNVPVVENRELVELLANIGIGDSIPSELYEAVAAIIAYITDIDKLMEGR